MSVFHNSFLQNFNSFPENLIKVIIIKIIKARLRKKSVICESNQNALPSLIS